MSHQNAGNPAQVYPYGIDIKDPNPEVVDLTPSDSQPPGVDEDEEIDLETALTSL